MPHKILITGGAGFIGSHLAKDLVKKNYKVTVYDNLDPQVHGKNAKAPDNFKKDGIKFIKGDILDMAGLKKAVKKSDILIHLAAQTGTGESMYAIERYVEVNVYGTAILLDLLVNTKNHLKKIILASSRAVYGEGKYLCKRCGVIYPAARSSQQIKAKKWEIRCAKCNGGIKPIPTDEDSFLSPASIYALTKQTQEQLVSAFGKVYGIPYIILRFQNVYGPGQSLKNPYTGILSTFSSRIMNRKPLFIFEDGRQTRDLVYIDDAVRATIQAIEAKVNIRGVFNVGSGKKVSILEVAKKLLEQFNADLKLKIINKGRKGDIRHCYADLAKIKKTLKFKPVLEIDEGLANLVTWVKLQKKVVDSSENAYRELEIRGIFG